MDCLHCHSSVVDASDLFFYCKKEKDVFLSIKPELLEVVLARKTLYKERESPKKVRVKCNQCLQNLGCEIPFGPNGTNFFAFACDKVKLGGRAFTKKQRWWQMHSNFQHTVETRDSATFFDVFNVSESIEKKVTQEADCTIKFPSLQNLNDFEWVSVSLDKKPRPYQIEAFVEALQRNLVVVIKTGAGKTLIASMFLARMCNLNPSKMGLMIVDRVPLVFQQGDAIRKDTSLRVVSICGENKTGYTVKQLNSNRFDVLVITAGAFYEMVTTKKELDVNLFCAVVLDECHHVAGGHCYIDVLGLFTDKRLDLQPRILGLTASPVNAKTLIQAENRLQEFLNKFPPRTKIFFPDLPKTDTTMEELSFRRTEGQALFIQQCIQMFQEQIEWISKTIGIKDIPLLQEELLNVHMLVGMLRSLDKEYREAYLKLHDVVNDSLLLLDAMVMCDVMGVPHGSLKLQNEARDGQFKDRVLCFQTCNEPSPRLVHLHQTLGTLNADSKTLVFVSTRHLATVLTRHLQETFPDMKIEKIVGHNGYDGMDWEGDQEKRIKDFAGDQCNLLVSTSVLEEGIDVESCHLVVCFTGVRSLIAFIQARGRGRKPGSRFIVYQNQFESERNRNRQLEENMMQSVLRRNQNSAVYFSNMSKDIIRKIETEIAGGELTSLKDRSFQILERGEIDFSFLVYIDVAAIIDSIEVKPSDIKAKLAESLEQIQEFKLNRLDIISDETDLRTMEGRIFAKETIVFLVGVQCVGHSNPLENYRVFCRIFSYQLEIDGIKCYLWTRMKFQPTGVTTDVQAGVGNNPGQAVPIKSFQLGYFENMMNYCVGYNYGNMEFCDGTISFKGKEVVLSWLSPQIVSDICITIPKPSVGNFVLLSMQRDYFTVALCLSFCPVIDTEDSINRRRKRFTALHNYDSVNAFGKYPLFLINFENTHLDEVTNVLNTMLPVPYFNVTLKEVEVNPSLDVSGTAINLHDVLWSLKCLEDSRSIIYLPDTPLRVANIFASKTKMEEMQLIERTVRKCCLPFDRPYFHRFEKLFNNTYAAFNKIPVSRRYLLDDVVPPNHFLVPRAVVTPLRIICLPAVPVASNRLLRTLANKVYRIMIVSFREENLSKIRDNDRAVLGRYKAIIAEGVVINNLQYHFLLSTSSQLRDHKAYFVAASYNEILSIRREIIPQSNHFTCPAKYISRLGIYGTADKNVGQLTADKVNIVDDLKAGNGDFVTDGAGKVSFTKARQIAGILEVETPSAFQVRYSGTKGILVATPDNDPDLHGKEIAIRRQSMIKFRNNDQNLCVSKTSTLCQFTLNREIITLLCAIPIHWQLEKTLLEYQENALSKYSEMFNDICIAQTELRNYLPGQYVDKLASCTMELLDEKYWISILQGIYRLCSKEIRTKTSIPVEQSCLVIGVPDPFGVLKEDEVFLQLDGGKVIKGPIMLFRNPCLHPGDVQRVTGVENIHLKHLYNVVVLPVEACGRSLAASCSGGDLDGDQYAVIWDENLIPPKESMYPPCEYAQLAAEVSETASTRNIDVDIEDQEKLAEFFVRFMSNDCLGRVAHKHLALCDIRDNGARDPLAVKLAESQAQAVDFPKTGVAPLIPKDALFVVTHFPDFMEKPLSETYISKKILGILYRRCRSLTYDFNVGLQGSPNLLLNMNLLVEGNERYLSSAADVYVAYAHDMEMLMRKFELKVEADVILGHATIRWSQHLEADKGKATNAIRASYDAIVLKYCKVFHEDVNDRKSICKKASAWYRVVNDPAIKITKRKKGAPVFRSFPWVVADILCDVRKENNREQQSRKLINIGETSLEYFKKNSKKLLYVITEKLKKMKEIEDAVERFTRETYGISKGFFISAYGSTSIYVCEAESDIDVCVLPEAKVFRSKIIPGGQAESFKKLPPNAQNKHFLQFVVSRAIDHISSGKKEIFDAQVPIVKCSFKECDKPVHCDISMNANGYRKTMYVHHLFAMKKYGACYLPLFWILVRWARISGIVRSVLNPDKLIDTAEFYALIIHVLELPPQVEENPEIRKPNRWSGIKHLYRKLDKFGLKQFHQLGKMLFQFFRKLSTMKGNVVMTWPAPIIQSSPVRIDESKMSTISSLAARAYHALSVTRDVNAMLNYFLAISTQKLQGFRKVLPLSVSYAIGKALSFHATRLSEVTGAVVTIDAEENKNNLVVYAEGNLIALENLQNELHSLQQTNKALVLGRLPQKSSRYFMEHSSLFLARNNTDPASVLSFEDSLGAYELHHHAHQRSSVFLHSASISQDEDDDSWKENQKQRLYDHVIQQLHNFPATNNELLEGFEVTTRFGCFYLVDIESRLPDAQNTIQIQELQLAVEKGRRSRKAWKRSEFRTNYSEYGLEEDSSSVTETRRFKMTHLPPVKNSKKTFVDKVKKDLYKNKKKKRGIGAAFTPGLLKNNTRDVSARETLLSSYHIVLKRCGFYKGQSTNRELSPAWKVSLNPSASYEVQLNLDSDLNVVKVAERPLNWVHGTILDGRKQHFQRNLRTNPDIRLLFATQDLVKEGSDLYRRVLPGGALPFQVIDGKPVVNSNDNNAAASSAKKRRGRNKNFISMIRHVQAMEMFTNGREDACIICGEIYFGDQMTLSRPFYEISLYFDTTPIKDAIAGNFAVVGAVGDTDDDTDNDEDCLGAYIRNIYDTSLLIKGQLDEVFKNQVLQE